MIIYFLRHASAGQSVSNPKKDEKRGLDEDGIEQCRQIGRALAALQVQLDVIISSPLKRASQTAALVANEMGHEGKLQLDPALRPEAGFSQFRDLIARCAKLDAIMVVGHNPNLSEFLGRSITHGAGEAEVVLRKGAVAQVDTKRNRAALRWCLTPKVVAAIQATAAESSRPKTSRK
jgi:phosphohistidine phosphatase